MFLRSSETFIGDSFVFENEKSGLASHQIHIIMSNMKSQKIENCIYTAKEKGCFNPGRVIPPLQLHYQAMYAFTEYCTWIDVDGGAYKKITPFTSSAVHSSLNLIIV